MIVAAFTDSLNNLIKAVKSYKAQNVAGGLGTGGSLAVQGAEEAKRPATTRTAKKKTSKTVK